MGAVVFVWHGMFAPLPTQLCDFTIPFKSPMDLGNVCRLYGDVILSNKPMHLTNDVVLSNKLGEVSRQTPSLRF